jgi:starvation-inducible DNA-binding protein
VIKETAAVPADQAMIAELVKDHESVCRTTRTAFEAASAANDESSCSLLSGRLELHEKTAWMLRSLIQTKV